MPVKLNKIASTVVDYYIPSCTITLCNINKLYFVKVNII